MAGGRLEVAKGDGYHAPVGAGIQNKLSYPVEQRLLDIEV